MDASDQTKRILNEGRARIMWGDPPDEVEAWMVESGMDQVFAAQVVNAATRERAVEARVQGVKDVVIGGVVAVISPIPCIVLLLGGMISMVVFGGCAAGFAYGLFRLIKGVIRLLAGARFQGAISDME